MPTPLTVDAENPLVALEITAALVALLSSTYMIIDVPPIVMGLLALAKPTPRPLTLDAEKASLVVEALVAVLVPFEVRIAMTLVDVINTGQ